MRVCVVLCLVAVFVSVGFSEGKPDKRDDRPDKRDDRRDPRYIAKRDDFIRENKRLIGAIFNFVGDVLTFAINVLKAGVYVAVDLATLVLTLPLELAQAAINVSVNFVKNLTYGCRLINVVDRPLGGDRYYVTLTLERTTCPREAYDQLKDPVSCPRAPGSDIICYVTVRKGNLLNLYKPIVESQTCS